MRDPGKRPLEPRQYEQRLGRRALGDLIDHILEAYHGPLREELQRLESLVREVDQRDPSAGAQRRSGLAPTFRALRLELEQHMVKEEQILFPMIRQGMGAHATGPIAAIVDRNAGRDCRLP